MKLTAFRRSAALAIAVALSTLTLTPPKAQSSQPFGQEDVRDGRVVAVAVPIGVDRYNLLVIEQQSDERPCWRERGANPTEIEPLLLDFNFSGICGRATDSNGYSIRMNNRDLGWSYLLRVVERGGELLLVGTPVNRSQPEIVIGRTGGQSGSGYTKIDLEPGWQFAKRTYQDKVLGHYYLASSSSNPASITPPTPSPVSTQPTPQPEPQPQPPAGDSSTLYDFVDQLCANLPGLPGCSQ